MHVESLIFERFFRNWAEARCNFESGLTVTGALGVGDSDGWSSDCMQGTENGEAAGGSDSFGPDFWPSRGLMMGAILNSVEFFELND